MVLILVVLFMSWGNWIVLGVEKKIYIIEYRKVECKFFDVSKRFNWCINVKLKS